MAIKVIKKKPSKNVVRKTVCNNCGATLEYTPADAERKTYKDYGGGSDNYFEFKCPNCGNLIQDLI